MSKFNVLEHEIVPEHHLVPVEDEDKILSELKTTKEALPKISLTDPAIRALEEALNTKIGENRIIKIIRKSPTAGYYEYYRVTVKGVF
ncbi:DNA-directed RNA polymerase subunit H [Picrophilus oshimae]|uniref:DNA-directed RNA polymerase subunit Rpo5 n=1 Tax=Picrophilus torridus (strain ATCC 700027 / DSM 9790 / JCM 10055 / NBRC 100828 / KAW 2/3) TaxID=1122961 RepID=Q6L2F7_PICTO|nr:DNA-directed RNA polymerase subunit H [Picrophilus oshimae]AAT42845.1 DNA-directed RNA polymerase subunit H [Picrophilus oshimae DSM 9789]SMD31605.1 DNA-directed RNA polymerase, subunit H [Picrophilus oshimae DSM 9789]